MIVAILILTIFNTGLIFILGIGVMGALKEFIFSAERQLEKHIDDRTETAVTAIYNMDGLKAKATMSGKVEI